MRYETKSWEDREVMRLRADLAALAFQFALLKDRIRRKANFDPNQPRVPRGQRDGGRWTNGQSGQPARSRPRGGLPSAPPTSGSGSPPAQGPLPPAVPGNPPTLPPRTRPTFDVELPVPRDLGVPSHLLDSAPKLPERRPALPQERFRSVRRVAYWAAGIALRANADPRRIVLHVLGEGAHWLIEEYWPYVREYFEPPKALDTLQADVKLRRRGTDIHHIVEQTHAERDGYGRALIDHPANLVRISTLRHWEVTAWYTVVREEFGWQTARVYLRGKSWDVRYQIGLRALRETGVLIK